MVVFFHNEADTLSAAMLVLYVGYRYISPGGAAVIICSLQENFTLLSRECGFVRVNRL